MKNVLVTGFEPFLGEKINPSAEMLRRLEQDFETLLLPTSFLRSWARLKERLDQGGVDRLVMLGQAGGRRNVGLERIAVNLMDTDVRDEDGNHWYDQRIHENGPAAYISRWPLREWLHLGKEKHLPLEISNSAGLYVCNCLYYQAFSFLRSSNEPLFIHLPFQIEQLAGKEPGTPALSLDLMEQVVRFTLQEVRLSQLP